MKKLISRLKKLVSRSKDNTNEQTGSCSFSSCVQTTSTIAGAVLIAVSVSTSAQADTTTPRLGLTLPTVGSPTWGQKINGNFQILDSTTASGNFINNQATLQSGATFYVSSGTVAGPITIQGTGGSGTNSRLITSFIALPRNGGVGPQVQDMVHYAHVNTDSGANGNFDLTVSTMPPSATNASIPASGNYSSIVMNPVGISWAANGSQVFGASSSGLVLSYLPGAGNLYADALGNVSTTTSSGGSSIYPATGTASFPVGINISTITGTDNWRTTGSILAGGTVGSDSGNYNIHTETVTISSPPANGTDYLLTVNNAVGSWSAAITDAMRTQHYNSVTSSTVFVAGSTLAVQGTLLDGTLSAGTSSWVLTSRGPNLPVQFLPGGSGSGYPNPGNADLNIATFNVTNVNNLKFSGTYDSGNNPWVLKPSTFSHVPGGAAGSITFTGNSSHTVEGLQFWAVAKSTFTGRFVLSINNSSSNSGGWKFSMIGPASPGFFTMTGGGSGASATTSNFSQQATALNTQTGTPIGTYTSNSAWFEFEFTLITGTTAGFVNVQICPLSGAGNNFINSESYITAVMD